MEFSLPEIQITYVILMGLLTLVIAFIVPHYTKNVRTFVVSRGFLVTATTLVTLHFVLQYILHKSFDNVENTRMLANMIFGFPISYTFTMSLMYLLRRGKIRLIEWAVVPGLYLLALVVLIAGMFLKFNVPAIMPFIAGIYAVALIYCAILQIREFFVIKARQRTGDHSDDMVLKWTQWSIFLMSFIGLGFPFMTFVENVTARSIYGIMSICVAFIYILGIMGYTLSFNIMTGMADTPAAGDDDADADKAVDETAEVDTTPVAPDTAVPVIDNTRMTRVAAAAALFVEQRLFVRQGITMRDAAREMGVSVNLLKSWLRTTKYGKFTNWIMILRIEYSQTLLSETPGISCDVVADKCGFCDRQYFQTQFSKIVGVTPSKWVRNAIDENA